jgi:hypothetical protein
MSANPYHRLPIAEKRALAIGSQREPAVTCPTCDTQVMPADLLAHMEQRCAGPREPGPGARWVTWREARAIVPERTLVRWVERGFVRHRGGRGDRTYLHRDLATRVSQMRGFRRR